MKGVSHVSSRQAHEVASNGNGLLINSGVPSPHKNKKPKNNFCMRCGSETRSGGPCNACGFLPSSQEPQSLPGIGVDRLSFGRWCSLLTVSVLRTRSPFASFLLATLHLQRSDQASSSSAFPLPIPFAGVFAKMPPGLSACRRKRIHFRRAVHVVVMALNFWWSGSCFIPMEHLERAPSKNQRALLRRISGLMLADGPLESFEVLRSGRRFPQLIARLAEISGLVTKLGIGAGPYERTYPGHDVPMDSSMFPELEPYRSLDASRLKVVGKGNFDATPFLSPELAMAYKVPDTLLSDRLPGRCEFPQKLDPLPEIVSLAKLWDLNGLLHIHDVDLQKERRFELVRVFNCFKNLTSDRQIGDRRGRNSVENRICGPSSQLPTGPDLLDIHLNARKDTLSIVCTDRRDFYHQFQTSQNRTMSNTVGPMVPLELLRDTQAMEAYAAALTVRKPSRLIVGDGLGSTSRQKFARCPKGYGMVSFKSIFQGDHAGVKIATCAHEELLKSAGLLSEFSRVVSNQPFTGSKLCEGLVIDDYFAIAVVPKGLLVPSPAVECLRRSKALYAMHELVGSDDKDICGERKAKIIGATVNASEQAQSRGHVLVSAPAEKRYALSWITLQICQLTHTSDSLHLCVLGGWTSILMFRRPFMSLLQRCFHLVDMNVFDPLIPKLVQLPRQVAQELTMLSILTPLMVADISVDFCARLFATDASLTKGAIVSSQLRPEVMECLWRCCRSKGGYSKLLTPGQSVITRCMEFEEEDFPKTETVRRPLAYKFDFVEVFAGAATVTSAVAALGYSVCCPIDISYGEELDVTKLYVIEWLIHLVVTHQVLAVLLEPPCTTFSVMRRPALRSKEFPFGFDLLDEQTDIGTKLAHRALQLLKVCARVGLTGILENPWSSKIKYLPGWSHVAGLDCCKLVM